MVVLVATRDVLEVRLGSGERIKCESDAIVTAGANASIDASMDGGFFGALARTALTGESFFLTTLSNRGETSMLVAQLSPQLPGEVHVLNQVPPAGSHSPTEPSLRAVMLSRCRRESSGVWSTRSSPALVLL
eukprot:m.422848 g.422848  ORF g.422848 m.422848 type:complete len:132 (+) comp38931_c0_seq1:250-645(+)